MTWVATPPPGAYPRGRGGQRRRRPYAGPPAYPTPPRWGFPSVAWRWPTSVPGARPEVPAAVDRVRYIAKHAVAMLWLLAGLAVVAAGSEIWRYVLLLRSRYGALSSGVVATSDTFVYAGAILALAVGALAVALTIWWLYVARLAAAEVAGYQPGRTDKQFFWGMLIPGINLVVAGSVFAELEHAAERRDPDDRPKPGKLVKWWWGLWVADGLLMAFTIAWRFRGGVQAQADGVVLATVTDLLGAAVAVLTILLIRRLVKLLAPIDAAALRPMRVVKVTDAPPPELRATRAFGSTR
ncbi:hypothetical protein AOZ06_00535 [Kibdelosporangium phytohabitans]|uniref:DUF4328 domain-containing protein n=2 Tax=Kibdelosporangium phytohabitans TaxID=860235 RepID=A0A0N7F5K0_9PSEU|nr:DUF4328 domain-containing protein [Kibdelosporangium phytohabitans]ALG14447.1 hypothetical protein AOZ06_00535 [Kibdelosporangium phytohabitans]